MQFSAIYVCRHMANFSSDRSHILKKCCSQIYSSLQVQYHSKSVWELKNKKSRVIICKSGESIKKYKKSCLNLVTVYSPICYLPSYKYIQKCKAQVVVYASALCNKHIFLSNLLSYYVQCFTI